MLADHTVNHGPLPETDSWWSLKPNILHPQASGRQPNTPDPQTLKPRSVQVTV